jgi:hypothetical protein
MPAAVPRECRWLRRAALAIRIAVGLLTLACASAAGVVAARALGSESPWIWTIAFLAGLASGAVLMGNPRLHGMADRIERAAQEREDQSRRGTQSLTNDGHG